MSNAQLADIAGVHKGTVSYWRNDAQIPSLEKRRRIAEYLDVSLSWLDHGVGDASQHGDVGTLAKRRLPPPVYEVVFDYLERMRSNGCTQEQIDQAERLMSDFAYAQLHSDPRRVKDVEEQLIDVRAAWNAIRESIERQTGKRL